MSDTVPATIFRAYDIRGRAGDPLSEPLMADIGRALGTEVRGRGLTRIVVARDGRLSGPGMSQALQCGLADTGLEVIDIGAVPTPVLYFAAHTLAEGSGAMVTASHNPPAYNGMKAMVGGETLHGDGVQALYRRVVEKDFVSGNGVRASREVIDAYLDRALEDGPLPRPFSVVVDCGNGIAGVLAGPLLRRLGCQVSELYCDVDGNFPNHPPDPSDPANLSELSRRVRAQGADLGLAFDGDGDRLVVVDSTGTVVWADRLLALFAEDLLGRQPGATVVYDIKCGLALPQVIERNGGRGLLCRSGHSIIKAAMVEHGALLAGELSGHFFFAEGWYGFDDGMFAAVRLLHLLARSPESPQNLFDRVPAVPATPELRVTLEEGEATALVAALIAEDNPFPDARCTDVDGLRADFDDGWGLVRASNTAPELVLRFEARDEAALERVQGRFRERLLALRPELQLPI